jgi:capsule assembly protein Wzi/PAP2 superfamily protein
MFFRVDDQLLRIALITMALIAVARAQTGVPAAPSASSARAGSSAGTKSSRTVGVEESADPFLLQPGEDPQNHLGAPFLKHIVGDQKQFWTSPARFRTKDLKWILPGAGITAAFIASDSWWSRQVNPSHVQTSLHISDYGTYSLLGLGGASFLFGHMTHNDHLQETGLLSGEAAINATGVTYLFKVITQRPRPLENNGNGTFFHGGYSFTSEHSAIAWSIASVWAHQYPGWFSQTAAYGLASAITLTRVTAKQHFPSDAIIGSALGWYFGRQVYRAHHDPELGGSGWGSLIEEKTGEKTRNPNYMASPYVPVDSWIYPALQRLIALGYTQSNMLGMRPWTRMACAKMLEDAGDKLQGDGVEESETGKIYRTLTGEFATELGRLDGAANVGARVESLYTRATGISGTPLRDGFHFGQTIVNDYGRPYWNGFNNVTGVTADAELGPVAFSFQGEYQHAPAVPSASPQVLAATAAVDGTPGLPNGMAEVNRFQLLNSTVSLNINNLQFTFGEQSLWLGPGEAGPLLMSNNAAPFPALKMDYVSPFHMPGFSRIFGPVRTEFYVGQLSGHRWETCMVPSCQSFPGYPNVVGPNIVPQPFIQGAKISFKPLPDLEIGMGTTTLFGGPGLPVTFGNFFRTFYAHTPNPATNPGKRVSAADITLRVPHIEDWLTIYLDSMVWDEISPIGSTRASVNPGVYMPRIPKIPKLELRAEGLNISRTREFPPGWVYLNPARYLSGYTQDGNLMGTWIGRSGRGGQGWLTYWLSPRNKLQFGYRLQTVNPKFVEGGRLVDYSAQTEFMLGSTVGLSGFLQYEQWRFPLISTARQTDITTSVQLTYYPKLRIHK